MNCKKSILSLVLAIAMIFSVSPTFVFADESLAEIQDTDISDSVDKIKTEENNEEIIDSSSEAELADVTVPEVALNWQEAGVRESDNKQIYKIVCNLSAPANLQMVETVLNYDDSKIQPVYAIGDLSNDQYSDLLYTEPDQDNRITVSGALEVAAKAGAAVANELYHADIEGRKAVRMTAGWTTPLSKAINSFDLMSFYFRLKDGVTLEDFDKETITLHPVQTYTEEQLSTGEDFGVEVRIFESSPAFAYKYSDVRESGYFESLGDSNIHDLAVTFTYPNSDKEPAGETKTPGTVKCEKKLDFTSSNPLTEQQQKDYGIYFEDNTDGSHTLTLYNANIEVALEVARFGQVSGIINLPANTKVILMGVNNIKNTIATSSNAAASVFMKGDGFISSDSATNGELNMSGGGYGIYSESSSEGEVRFENAKINFSDSNYTSGSGIFISYAKQNVIFDNSNITVTNTKGNGLDFSGTVTFRNNSKINVNSSGGAAGVKGNKSIISENSEVNIKNTLKGFVITKESIILTDSIVNIDLDGFSSSYVYGFQTSSGGTISLTNCTTSIKNLHGITATAINIEENGSIQIQGGTTNIENVSKAIGFTLNNDNNRIKLSGDITLNNVKYKAFSVKPEAAEGSGSINFISDMYIYDKNIIPSGIYSIENSVWNFNAAYEDSNYYYVNSGSGNIFTGGLGADDIGSELNSLTISELAEYGIKWIPEEKLLILNNVTIETDKIAVTSNLSKKAIIDSYDNMQIFMYGDNSIKYTGTEADACGIFTGTSNIVGIEDSTNQPPTLSIDMNGNGISAIETKNSDTQYINFKNINVTAKNSENGIYLDGYSWYTALGFNFDNSSVAFENVNSAINLNNLGFVDFKSTNSKFDFGNSSNIIAGDKSLMTGKILSDKKSRYTVGNADGALWFDTKLDAGTYYYDGTAFSSISKKITIDTGIVGGTVSVENPDANIGDTVVLTVEPNEGYTFANGSLTYTELTDGANPVVITENNGTYSFVMPENGVLITAAFAKNVTIDDSKITGADTGNPVINASTTDEPSSEIKNSDVSIPKDVVDSISSAVPDSVVINTDVAEIELDKTAFEKISNTAGSEGISLKVDVHEASSNETVNNMIMSGAKVIDVKLMSGTTELLPESSAGSNGNLTLKVPYETEAAVTNPSKVSVVYINDAGEKSGVASAYDTASKKVITKLKHLSTYAITDSLGYELVTELVTPSNENFNPGDEIAVAVKVKSSEPTNFGSFNIALDYDSTKMTLTSVEASDAIKTNGYNLVQGEGAEQNKIAYTSGSSSVDVSSEAVTIMTVKYTVNRGIETAANVSVGTKDGYFAPTGADTDIAAVSTAETVNLYNLKVTLSSGDGNTVSGSPAAYYTKYNTAGLYTDDSYTTAVTDTQIKGLVTANENYRLAKDTTEEPLWKTSGGTGYTSTDLTTGTYTEDTSLTAQAVRQYKITFEPGTHGSFAAGAVTEIAKDVNSKLLQSDLPTIEAEAGYNPDGWMSGDVKIDLSTYEVTGDATLTAAYTEAQYSVTFNTVTNGAYTGETGVTDGKATYGTDITFSVEPANSGDIVGYVYYTVNGGNKGYLTGSNGVYTIPYQMFGENIQIYAGVITGTVKIVAHDSYNAAPSGKDLVIIVTEKNENAKYVLQSAGTAAIEMYYSEGLGGYAAFVSNNGTTITEQEVKDRLSVMEGETANTVIAHTADINGDGYVRSVDAMIVNDLYYNNRIGDTSDEMRIKANYYNSDDAVDTSDIAAVLYTVVGRSFTK